MLEDASPLQAASPRIKLAVCLSKNLGFLGASEEALHGCSAESYAR